MTEWIETNIESVWQPTERCNPKGDPESFFRYVSISSVDDESKKISNADELVGQEAPSRARMNIKKDDVLVSTVRPYLNAVALVPDELDGEVASTGFAVLRADPELLDPRFLFYFVQTQGFIGYLKKHMRGASYPAVTKTDVTNAVLKLPPPSEQRRIVDLLDRANALRKKCARANEISKRILPALFYDMFGDPASNPKGWKKVELRRLITRGPRNGLYKPKSKYGTGTRILRIDGFYAGRIVEQSSMKRVQATNDEIGKYALREGDIVINRVNSEEYLGKCALVPSLSEPTIFESNMMRFSVDTDRVHPVYLAEHLQSDATKSEILQKAKRAINQASINQQDVKSFSIALPPLDLQETFAKRAQSIEHLIRRQAHVEDRLDKLFDVLLHRAFTGELTADWRAEHEEELRAEREEQLKALGVEQQADLFPSTST